MGERAAAVDRSRVGGAPTASSRSQPPRDERVGARPAFDFASLPIHAMAVAPQDDPHEVEAHAIADRIAGPRPRASGGDLPSSGTVTACLGAGRPLDALTRRRFEPELGADLSSVRIHTGEEAADSARSIGASAYSVGNHVVFGRDHFQPATGGGAWLLAHELAHTVQHAVSGEGRVVHRAPEDVPRLEREFDEGLAAGGAAGFRKAAEALNAFADYDIRRMLQAGQTPAGRKLGRGLIVELHQAALDDPKLGPNSNVARITRPVYLQVNFKNEIQKGNWQGAAEFLNGFNEKDMLDRMRPLTLDELRNIQLGALTNPKLGKDSGVAKHVETAIKVARQAAIDVGLAMTGDGQPGAVVTTVTVGSGAGNPDVGVPAADRDPLPQDADGRADAAYIDKNIVNAHYNVLTGLFEIQYAGGGFIHLVLDAVLKGAKSGSPAIVAGYFRHRKNGRVYPANFNRREIPTICSCALEIEKKIPEAQARTIETMIDVAVSAQGVAAASLRVGQAISPSSGSGKGTAKQAGEPEPKPDPKAGPSTGTSTGSGKGSGSVSQGPEGMSASAQGKGGGGGPAPKSGGGQAGGHLQEVTPGKVGAPPVQDLPSEIQWGSGPLKSSFGKYFETQLAYGTAKVGGKVLGEGALVKAAPGATVVGATTTVAEGTLEVGGMSVIKALVVTGGKFLPSAVASGGRAVYHALVFKNITYLIVSPASGTDQPAQAPGKDTTAVTAPGKDSTAVKAPGLGQSAPMTDPTPTTPMEAPGPLVDEPAECKKHNAAKIIHYHHVFPQKFRQLFSEIGIQIDKYTVKMGWQEHIGKDGLHVAFGWNDEWLHFFDDMPEPSKMSSAQAWSWHYKALNFGYRLMVEASIDRRTLYHYVTKKKTPTP